MRCQPRDQTLPIAKDIGRQPAADTTKQGDQSRRGHGRRTAPLRTARRGGGGGAGDRAVGARMHATTGGARHAAPPQRRSPPAMPTQGTHLTPTFATPITKVPAQASSTARVRTLRAQAPGAPTASAQGGLAHQPGSKRLAPTCARCAARPAPPPLDRWARTTPPPRHPRAPRGTRTTPAKRSSRAGASSHATTSPKRPRTDKVRPRAAAPPPPP